MDGIKHKFIGYYPKDKVVDHMKKSIEEVIWYAVDGPEFIKETKSRTIWLLGEE